MFKYAYDIIVKSYISILFLRNKTAGTILLLTTFLLPSVGFLGLTAIFSTVLFAELIKVREHYIKYGFYLYNSLLVGMGVGYYYQVTLYTVIITAILSILTFLLSFSLNKVLEKYGLPLLSLPFALVSIVFTLASVKYISLLSNILNRKPVFDIPMEGYFSYFFQSMGTILFLPYVIAGIIISLIILYYSRILFFSALTGFITGVWFHSLFVPFEQALTSPYNFNFILIFMALNGVFLLSNKRSIFLAFIGVAVSSVLIDSMESFFNLYGLPVYTLPFNIVTMLFILILYTTGYKYFNYNIKGTPEHSLEYYLNVLYRFGGNKIKIGLPFTGTWNVYQGFNGEWTHKGKWKYAYDFVIEKNGKTYKDEGMFLEDYYAFGKPVVSPVNGYVISVENTLPDNYIGHVDRINNWGNYIIIQSVEGFYVEISHFMQHSITVKPGDYVKTGQIIGKCGNSGYSPEPHIHIQIQKYGLLGSETVPFVFINYIHNNRLIKYNSIPTRKKEKVEALTTDVSLHSRLNFILDDSFQIDIIEKNRPRVLNIKVKMNDKGEFYFSDGKNNRLYFYLNEYFFYFYEYDGNPEADLALLYKTAPRIPLTNRPLFFKDVIPFNLRYTGYKKILYEMLLPFNYSFFNKTVLYKKNQDSVKSKYGILTFKQNDKGFGKIIVKNKKL